jgi:hypothetical protein
MNTKAKSSILLVGGSDAGKTNFLARLWLALAQRDGRIVAPTVPQDVSYVEGAVKHLLQGEFAPHSTRDDGRRDFRATIEVRDSGVIAELVVPDVSGELWSSAVESREIDAEWMDTMNEAAGAIIFVRVLSDSLCNPLDWATAKDLLQSGLTGEEDQIPTQVILSELLTFLEATLRHPRRRPRVGIIVTAWDMLDAERAGRAPMAFIEEEFPMFAGRVRDASRLEIEVFGFSAVGGDLKLDPAFKEHFLEEGIRGAGFVIVGDAGAARKLQDVTVPIAWVLGAESSLK